MLQGLLFSSLPKAPPFTKMLKLGRTHRDARELSGLGFVQFKPTSVVALELVVILLGSWTKSRWLVDSRKAMPVNFGMMMMMMKLEERMLKIRNTDGDTLEH